MDNKLLAAYIALAVIIFLILAILETRKRRQGVVRDIEKKKKKKDGSDPDEPKCSLCGDILGDYMYAIPKVEEDEKFINIGSLKFIKARKIVPSNVFGCGQCKEFARSECEKMLQHIYTVRAKQKKTEIDELMDFKEKLFIRLKDRLRIERDRKKELGGNGKS